MIPVNEVQTWSPDLITGDVMVVSNEDTPILEGKIIGFDELTQARQLIPVVQTRDGERYVCLGVVLPYHEGLKRLLDRLPGRQRFKLLGDIFSMRAELNRIERTNLQT